MKTLERYILGSFLSSFVLAFLVLSFVLTIGLMVQIVGLVLDGVSARLIGEYAMVSFPETLQWTMPLALLVSSVLVFSRMSADSEIAAMRACGVNLLSVIRGPLLFAFGCTLLGCYINNEIVPRGHEVRRNLKTKVSVGAGLEVLEPGRVIGDFSNVKVYFGSKQGNWLHDLVIMDYTNDKIARMITASKANVTSEGRDIALELYNMTVDPLDEKHPNMARATRLRYLVKDALAVKKYDRRTKDLRFFELVDCIRTGRIPGLVTPRSTDSSAEVSEAIRAMEREFRVRTACEQKVEFSKRLVFAFASLGFVLIGIPLGIKAQRRESSVGMAISLGVSLGYYLIVMLMLGLESAPSIHPELLIWLPVLGSVVLAATLLRRHL